MKLIKDNKLVIFILTIGIIFRLLSTANGNFIFHMDSARDYVDVREMVELKKLRLTGPTSAIDGVYTGPAWYYLLAIPYILSDGNPYSGILMEIVLWTIGGIYLYKLTKNYGFIAYISSLLLWCFAPYITLLTKYTYNPNPVTLLAPLWIYLLYRFIETKKLIYSFLVFFLSGIFFNFEMNVGFLLPFFILFSVLILKPSFLKDIKVWLTTSGFLICLVPQILFDLKHQFIMSNSLLKFISTSTGNHDYGFKVNVLLNKFHEQISATLFNQQLFSKTIEILVIVGVIYLIYKKEFFKDILQTICFIIFIISFLAYLILPVTVNSWHLGFIVTASIIFFSILTKHQKVLGVIFLLFVTLNSISSLYNFFNNDYGKVSDDQSVYKNEINAIDYVYQKADGKSFRVYTHIPSVYDYPYQYLFWWYGNKKYGYLPTEYTYLPEKPQYIPSQDKFQNQNPKSQTNLVFLIEEIQNPKLLDLWINSFINYPSLDQTMIGPIKIETRLLPNQPFLSLRK